MSRIFSALAKVGAIFRPGKSAPRAKAANPTILRVGIDGDDDMRIVFIIEDEASGQQFAHVSLDVEGAIEAYQGIEGLIGEICDREEAELQKGELNATEAFQGHCNRLAQADRLKAADDAYMQLAADADIRLVTKLAAQAVMYGKGYDESKGELNAATRAIADAEARHLADKAARQDAFKADMARLVADVEAEQAAEEARGRADMARRAADIEAEQDRGAAGMAPRGPGKPAEADKS